MHASLTQSRPLEVRLLGRTLVYAAPPPSVAACDQKTWSGTIHCADPPFCVTDSDSFPDVCFPFFPEDSLMMSKKGYLWYCGVVMSGEDAPRPYPEDLIVLEIKTNKQESLLVTERRAMMLI